MKVRGAIAVVAMACFAGAPGAGARSIEPDAWATVAGAQAVVKKDRLSVPLPGTIAAELETRELREITLRVREGCALAGRLAIDGAAVREFEAGKKGGPVELRARAGPGTHTARIDLDATGGCGRAVIESASLREWVPIGTDFESRYMGGEYEDLVAAKVDSVTAGHDFQWNRVEPRQGLFDFAGADRVVGFGEEHGMATRGHPLVWRAFIPGYARDRDLTRAQMLEIMRNHIQTIVGRYAGTVDEWDVVNEAISDKGGLRNVFWRKTIGREYIALAFHFAHAADPDAKLYLNEYGAEEPGRKADGLYRAAETLVAAGVPIDGVGFQYHASTERWPDADEAVKNMKRFAALGLKVQITEADVADNTNGVGSDHSRAQQRDAFSAAARACKRVVACERFTMWGLADEYSWLGERKQPLPFDSRLKSKPSWGAITDALRPR